MSGFNFIPPFLKHNTLISQEVLNDDTTDNSPRSNIFGRYNKC